jgi:hypothetical protein
MWMINNSLDFETPNAMLKFNIKPEEDSSKFNPYYSFFVIVNVILVRQARMLK